MSKTCPNCEREITLMLGVLRLPLPTPVLPVCAQDGDLEHWVNDRARSPLDEVCWPDLWKFHQTQREEIPRGGGQPHSMKNKTKPDLFPAMKQSWYRFELLRKLAANASSPLRRLIR